MDITEGRAYTKKLTEIDNFSFPDGNIQFEFSVP